MENKNGYGIVNGKQEEIGCEELAQTKGGNGGWVIVHSCQNADHCPFDDPKKCTVPIENGRIGGSISCPRLH